MIVAPGRRRVTPLRGALAAFIIGVLSVGPPLLFAQSTANRPDPGDDLHPFVELLLRVPLHFAHRGGARDWPEHTLLAYDNAVDQAQTDVLELDVHLSADGVPVVIHDATLDRTTDKTGDVASMTLAQLKDADAGYRFTQDGQSFPYRGQGLTIPTLEEVLEAVADPDYFGGPTPWINIEIKVVDRQLEEAVAALIEAKALTDRVCLGSFHSITANRMKQRLPDACHFYPIGAGVCFGADVVADAGLEGCPDYDVLEIPYEILLTPFGERVLAEAQHDDIPVVVWTVNDPEAMTDLLEMGVHGIMTDKALTLRQIFNDAGFPPNPSSGY